MTWFAAAVWALYTAVKPKDPIYSILNQLQPMNSLIATVGHLGKCVNKTLGADLL